MTTSSLRPDPIELGHEWRRIVEEEYEQVESIREWRDEDHYEPVAHHFAADPYREDDEIVNRLKSFAGPETTWLDIGAGGGRNAFPLALVSRQVIAVEPSAGMRGVLANQAEEHGITNVAVHDYHWPDGADQLSADISLNAHVGYDIRNINEFIDGLERASRSLCITLLMDRSPSGGFVRLWEQVHGFKRQQLPAMREFLHLLLARGVSPEVELYPRKHREWAEGDLIRSARQRLWLVEGSEKDGKLQQLLAEERAAGVNDYQQPTMIALIRWTPSE